MTETTDPSHLLLQSHGSALRRLAEHLLNDPNEVDDALQECWVQVLASPPQHDHRIRAWLETVLRNVVRKRARTRQRAEHRERTSARREELAPTIDVVTRRQTLAALTHAIDSLSEGAQEVVFLRYFDELPPRAIAARVGRPVEQVYRELDRARQKLRAQLEDERADWRKALLGFCGLRPSAAAGWLLTGSLLMLIKHKLVLGLGSALFVFLIAALCFGPESIDIAAKVALPDTPSVQATRVAMDTAAGNPDLREEVVPPVKSDGTLTPYEYELEFLAIDEDDVPAADVDLLIAPFGHDLNKIHTDAQGIARVRWRARTPSFDLVYGASRRVLGDAAVQRVTVHAGTTNRLVLRVSRRSGGMTFLRLVSLSTKGNNTTWSMSAASQFPSMSSEDKIWYEFVSRSQTQSGEPRAVSVLRSRLVSDLHSKMIDFNQDSPARSITGMVWSVKDQAPADPAGLGRLVGSVLRADGQAATDTLVRVSRETEQGHVVRQTRTDDKGAFELEGLSPGTYSARAGGGDHGRVHHEFSIMADAKVEWQAQLDRGLELRIRIVDAAGNALPKWRVELLADGIQAWIDGATADDNGRFAIPNLQNRAHRLRCYGPKGSIPLWIAESLWPAAEEITVRIPDSALVRGDCRVQPRLNGDVKWTFGPLQMWRNDGHGVMLFDGGDKGFDVNGLPSDIWQIYVAGRGLGLDAPADLHVLPGSRTAQSHLRDEPACVVLPPELDLGEKVVRFSYLHRDVISRAGELSDKTRRIWLRPGSYSVHHNGQTWPIEVTPGELVLEWPDAQSGNR